MMIRMTNILLFFCLAMLLILSACKSSLPKPLTSSTTPQPLLTATIRLPSSTISVSATNIKTKTATSTLTPSPTKIQTITLSPDEAINKTKTASVGCNIIPAPEIFQPVAGNESIFLSGRFVLCPGPGTETFDLDTGEVGIYDVLPYFEWEERKYKSETDIMLYMAFNSIQPIIFTHVLIGINGAQIENAESDTPTTDGCMKIIKESPTNQSAYAEVGNVVCVITNQGRFSVVRVESVDSYGWGSIEMSFTTWNQPVKSTSTPFEK